MVVMQLNEILIMPTIKTINLKYKNNNNYFKKKL